MAVVQPGDGAEGGVGAVEEGDAVHVPVHEVDAHGRAEGFVGAQVAGVLVFGVVDALAVAAHVHAHQGVVAEVARAVAALDLVVDRGIEQIGDERAAW